MGPGGCHHRGPVQANSLPSYGKEFTQVDQHKRRAVATPSRFLSDPAHRTGVLAKASTDAVREAEQNERDAEASASGARPDRGCV